MLKIFLGAACNLSCAYCLQDNRSDSRVKNPRYRDIALRYRALIERSGISYWGGEPSLYWREIAGMEETLHELGFMRSSVPHRITTNGTLITDEQVADVNRWGARITLSYHGSHDQIRYGALRRAERISMTFLLDKTNHDIRRAFAEADEASEIAGRRMPCYVHWCRATPDVPEHVRFDMTDVPKLRDDLFGVAEMALRGDRRSVEFFAPHLAEYLGLDHDAATVSRCYSPEAVVVMLDGSTYTCHHRCTDATRTGNALAGIPVVTATERANATAAHRFISAEPCRSCKHLSWCKGGCHLSQTHDVECAIQHAKAECFDYLLQHNFERILHASDRAS